MKRIIEYILVESIDMIRNSKSNPRSYVLLIKCSESKIIRTRAREFNIERGFYIYIGSCGVNCSRVIRHIYSRRKRLFWHIDYLLSECKLLSTLIVPEIRESDLAYILSKASFLKPIKGFGSSDDRVNISHLFMIHD